MAHAVTSTAHVYLFIDKCFVFVEPRFQLFFVRVLCILRKKLNAVEFVVVKLLYFQS